MKVVGVEVDWKNFVDIVISDLVVFIVLVDVVWVVLFEDVNVFFGEVV